MGLPIWRDPKENDSRDKLDPTAQARSAIRRRPVAPATTIAIPPVPALLIRTDSSAQGVSSNRRSPERALAAIHRHRARGVHNPGGARHTPTVPAPTGVQANAPGAEQGEQEQSHGNGQNTRPRSRRGPQLGLTLPSIFDAARNSLPPLRRMSGRSINDEPAPAGSPSRRPGRADTPPSADGLGDRRRSRSPDSPRSDYIGWSVMGETITPDPSLPSAGNSFTSVAASSSTSSSTSLSVGAGFGALFEQQSATGTDATSVSGDGISPIRRGDSPVALTLDGPDVCELPLDFDALPMLPGVSGGDLAADRWAAAERRELARRLAQFMHGRGPFSDLTGAEVGGCLSALSEALDRLETLRDRRRFMA